MRKTHQLFKSLLSLRLDASDDHPSATPPLVSFLIGELRAAMAWLRMPHLWVVLSVGVVVWALAYRLPYSFQLDFGGDTTTGRRYDDAPYVLNFHAPEPNDRMWWDQWHQIDPIQVYRWSSEESTIFLPGIGAGNWLVSVTAGAQPTNLPTRSRWSDGATTVDVPITRDPRHDQHVYRFLTHAPGGDLTLRLTTPPYIPPNDSRALGFRAYHATFVPVGARLPPLNQMALLAIAVALMYGTCCRLGMPRPATILIGLSIATIIALLLIYVRLALTVFTPTLPILGLACYGLAVVGLRVWGYRPLAAEQPSVGSATIAIDDRRPIIVALVVFAFALRLGGMLHPHTIFSDIGLHSHNLASVTQGAIYFTEQLPTRAGGGFAPYPPGQYLILAPLQLLFPGNDAGLRLLMIVGNALWDSLIVGLLWYTLRQSGVSERAALLGAALYTIAPPLLKSFSVGEFANIFGQGLALPLLVLLVLNGHRLGERRVRLEMGLLLALALLGHLGVSISLVLLLACLAALWLVMRRRMLPPLLLAGAAAGLLVAVLYYTAFADLLAARVAAEPLLAPQLSWGEKVANQLADNRGISVLTVILSGIGLVVLRPRGGDTAARRGLSLVLLAWWGATLLSFGLLLFATQGVRWQHFLYPALCLSAGPALDAIWARGRIGRVVAGSVFAFVIITGIIQWVDQLTNYLHQ